MAMVAPSLLSCDFTQVAEESLMLNESRADWFHLDVMDGQFVPNITFGMPLVAAFKRHAEKPLDVHLMIVNPHKYYEAFRKAGADHISFHIEAVKDPAKDLGLVKATGAKAGIAINPKTPISDLEPYLKDTDIVCLMGVEAGFGGQGLIEGTQERIAELKAMIQKAGAKTMILLDGGVNSDILVAGSFVFKSMDPMLAISYLAGLKAS